MKLFQDHGRGFIFSFGFDMMARRPNSRIICWNDPNNGSWELNATGQAGNWNISGNHVIAPEFVFRRDGGAIVAYQPGLCIEITYVGPPYIWSFALLYPDEPLRAAA